MRRNRAGDPSRCLSGATFGRRAEYGIPLKLAVVLCAFIGLVQLVATRSLFGVVWLVAAVVLFAIDRYGE